MTGLAFMSAVLFLAVPVVVVVLLARALVARRGARPGDGRGVRRFFQYLLMLGLLVVTLVGLGRLLTLAVAGRGLVDPGADLAQGLTFAVVGGGLLTLVVVWTVTLARSDPAELASIAWAVYLTLAGLVTAVVAAVQLGRTVAALVDQVPGLAEPAVLLVVWSLAWAVHWRLARRTLDEARRLPLVVLGSIGGFGAGVAGLVAVLAAAIRVALAPAPLVGSGAGDLGVPLAVLAAGAFLWVPHWVLRLARTSASPVWQGYVLVVGVGVSLVVTLVGASITVNRALVWLVGDPGRTPPEEYLAGTATPVAVALVGALAWWYHRAVFGARAIPGRSEIGRLHEYLLAGIALAAAATGVALVVVALVDAAAPAPIIGATTVNAVLAAVTLLVVGGPLWWVFWSRVRRARAADPAGEAGSPTRRVYLVLLFGVAGVVAAVAVLAAVFVVLEDLIGGPVGSATLRDVRVPLGILIAAGVVSAYHWSVQREDKGVAPRATGSGPRLVVLVGPRDDALAASVRALTGARIDGWPAAGPPWDHSQVLGALAPVTGGRVLLWSAAPGLQVVTSDDAGPVQPAAAGPRHPSPADAGDDGDDPGAGGEQGKP